MPTPKDGGAPNYAATRNGIPAYTYEAADNADRAGIRAAAQMLARDLPAALATP